MIDAPVKEKLHKPFVDEKLAIVERDSVMGANEKPASPDTKPSFFDKLKLKFPAIKTLVVAVADLFTRGAASKIENSIDALLTNPEDKTEVENKINLSTGGSTMLETLKGYLVTYLV